jgi:oxepin-CoA hydrolase/3-oxo-5,6-dehydrosuberyl-CoA semialdehyde dehydrogenase
MTQFFDISNRAELRRLLLSLDPQTTPIWGKMTSQQMVEHLVDQVQWTNGEKIPFCERPADEAYQSKMEMVYSDKEIGRGVVFQEPPEDYQFPDIATAVNQLMQELETFDRYFEQPGITAIHGGFGPMNHHEWLIWHGKHFTHHLKQFGLIA